MNVRLANESDWTQLQEFFSRIYRPSHPLRSKIFWDWRFGDIVNGGSIVATEGKRVIGHVGVAKSSGIAWIINVYLDVSWRGKGLLREMYSQAEAFGPLAATNVNKAGVEMYRKMGWYGYANLKRYVFTRKSLAIKDLLAPTKSPSDYLSPIDNHYWRQPGIVGLASKGGSSAVDFRHLGGIRIVEVANLEDLQEFIDSSGANWADYVTSWNDPLSSMLESIDWSASEELGIPWFFDPIDLNSKMSINVFSKETLPRDLIIRRWDSDHGRVGSILCQ